MKRLILAILASSGLVCAHAQSVIPDALGGAVVGTVIGGIAGGNCHNGFSGNGAAIGAGVGLVAGAVLGAVQQRNAYASQPCYYYPAPAAYVQPGYGYVSAPVYAAAVKPVPQVYLPAARPVVVTRQIPDARRVPDAPTF